MCLLKIANETENIPHKNGLSQTTWTRNYTVSMDRGTLSLQSTSDDNSTCRQKRGRNSLLNVALCVMTAVQWCCHVPKVLILHRAWGHSPIFTSVLCNLDATVWRVQVQFANYLNESTACALYETLCAQFCIFACNNFPQKTRTAESLSLPYKSFVWGFLSARVSIVQFAFRLWLS